MVLRRMLGIILLVLATSAALVTPAVAAGPYGPKPGAITVSKTVVEKGKTVQVRADGYCPSVSVKVTVTAKRYRTSFLEGSNRLGAVSTKIRLDTLGINTITIRGCRAGGGPSLSLSATVRVVRHQDVTHVNDSTVKKGDRVKVWAGGFCRQRAVTVRVRDDGNEYKSIVIRSDKKGRAATTVKLTRAGRTTLVLTGCRAKGLKQARPVIVTVRNTTSQSFTASPAAYVRDAVSGVPAPAYAGLAGGLLVLLAGGQLLVGRRRRS